MDTLQPMMIAHYRFEHPERGTIALAFDASTKRVIGEFIDLDDADGDRMEAIIGQLCQDGDLRPLLVWLRSRGYAVWMRVEDDRINYLIREVLPEA